LSRHLIVAHVQTRSVVQAEEADRVVKAKQAHENEREMIRNKNLESINELRINLENKIEDLEKTFDEVKRGSLCCLSSLLS
jgi:uncharacterized protein YlxW (UPF0749 family)